MRAATEVPVSTSQAIVGAVAGVGIGIVGLDASYFKLGVLLKIFSAWVVSPVLTMILAFVLYKLLSRLLRNANSMVWG